MSGEISPNVGYLISQLERKAENRVEVKIGYEGRKIEGGGGQFPLDLTKERPTIDIADDDGEHRTTNYKTLVRRGGGGGAMSFF